MLLKIVAAGGGAEAAIVQARTTQLFAVCSATWVTRCALRKYRRKT